MLSCRVAGRRCALRLRPSFLDGSARTSRRAGLALRPIRLLATDGGGASDDAAADREQLYYSPVQKQVMSRCRELHASIMPLNERVSRGGGRGPRRAPTTDSISLIQ